MRQPAADDELQRGVAAGETWVAENRDGTIVGFAQVTTENFRTDDANDRQSVPRYLAGVAVHPGFRRQGIASGLVASSLPRTSNGAYAVVHPANFEMLRVLFAHGFVATRLIRDYFGPDRDRLYLSLPAGLRLQSHDDRLCVPAECSTALVQMLDEPGRVITGIAELPHGWQFQVDRFNVKDPFAIRTAEMETSVQLTGVLLTVQTFLLGFALAIRGTDPALVALLALALTVSLIAAVVYANASGEMARLDDVRFDRYLGLGNILSEFGGVLPTLQIVPVIVAAQLNDPTISLATCLAAGAVSAWYQAARLDIQSRYLPQRPRYGIRTTLAVYVLRASEVWIVLAPTVGWLSFRYGPGLGAWVALEMAMLLLAGGVCLALGEKQGSVSQPLN